MLRLGDFRTVPDLVADFLLVLFPVANAAAAEEDDGDDDEEEEDDDDGHGDDACSVGGWRGREAGDKRCVQDSAGGLGYAAVVVVVSGALGKWTFFRFLQSQRDNRRWRGNKLMSQLH